jgi:predicted GNAT superfamily acetyltransferase
VSVPANIADLRTADPERARAIQAATGEALDRAFAEGLAVIGFERTDEAGTYLLGKWEPQ